MIGDLMSPQPEQARTYQDSFMADYSDILKPQNNALKIKNIAKQNLAKIGLVLHERKPKKTGM